MHADFHHSHLRWVGLESELPQQLGSLRIEAHQ
jgi:hypothetical protein